MFSFLCNITSEVKHIAVWPLFIFSTKIFMKILIMICRLTALNWILLVDLLVVVYVSYRLVNMLCERALTGYGNSFISLISGGNKHLSGHYSSTYNH